MAADRKQNVMLCAQIMDAYPTVPSYLKHNARNASHKKNSESISSSHHSKGSSTAASSMYTTSPVTAAGGEARDVGSSSAPPPAPPSDPSPPRSNWGFGRKEALPSAGEGKIYYDSDGEVESTAACGLSWFSCVTRN